MNCATELKDHVYDIVGARHSVQDELGPGVNEYCYMRLLKMPCGIIVNFYPKFATIERYFYDADKREILTSDGKPFLDRQLGAGELARAPKTSCFQ